MFCLLTKKCLTVSFWLNKNDKKIMKHYISLLLIGAITIASCGPSAQPNNAPATNTSAPQAQTPPPADTAKHASADTVKQEPVEPPFPYSGYAIYCENLAQSVEFYEADSMEIPSDSVLERMGVGITREGGNIKFSTDSSAIKEIMQTVSVTRHGKKITITYDGHSKEYTGNKVTIDDGEVSIDGKEIAYMNDMPKLPALKIGMPRASNLAISGLANVKCHVTLNQLNGNLVTGKGSYVACDSVHSMLPLSTKDSTTVVIKHIHKASSISLGGAGDVTIAVVDTIPITTINGSGNINLPKNTIVISQKSKGDGEVVMK